MNRRRGLVSLALLVAVLAGAAVGHGFGWGGERDSAVADRSPVQRALHWLEGHDYTVLSQVEGGRLFNATAAHQGGRVRGDLQTMTAGGGRQLGYAEFRLESGDDLSRATGNAASVWSKASVAQRSILADLVQPRRVLNRLGPVEELAYVGRAGDAEVYRGRNRSTLYLVGDRPARVVVHPRRGSESQVFQFSGL